MGKVQLFRFDQFSPSELQRLLHLRAIEWVVWPAFLSQPVLPLLYTIIPVHEGLLLVFIVSLLWVPIRYRFVSLQLATLGCFWELLEWLTIPAGVIFLLTQKRFVAALFALGTPLIVGLLGIPGKVGIVEAMFYVQSGDAEPILR